MYWILILSIVTILLWLFYRGSPRNFAKGVAKAQLTGYRRFSSDGLPKKEAYIKAISSRPGVYKYYSENEMKKDAEKANFRTMVQILAYREFTHRLKARPTIEIINNINDEINKIIPNDY